jgi:hypothetical protein
MCTIFVLTGLRVSTPIDYLLRARRSGCCFQAALVSLRSLVYADKGANSCRLDRNNLPIRLDGAWRSSVCSSFASSCAYDTGKINLCVTSSAVENTINKDIQLIIKITFQAFQISHIHLT